MIQQHEKCLADAKRTTLQHALQLLLHQRNLHRLHWKRGRAIIPTYKLCVTHARASPP